MFFPSSIFSLEFDHFNYSSSCSFHYMKVPPFLCCELSFQVLNILRHFIASFSHESCDFVLTVVNWLEYELCYYNKCLFIMWISSCVISLCLSMTQFGFYSSNSSNNWVHCQLLPLRKEQLVVIRQRAIRKIWLPQVSLTDLILPCEWHSSQEP